MVIKTEFPDQRHQQEEYTYRKQEHIVAFARDSSIVHDFVVEHNNTIAGDSHQDRHPDFVGQESDELLIILTDIEGHDEVEQPRKDMRLIPERIFVQDEILVRLHMYIAVDMGKRDDERNQDRPDRIDACQVFPDQPVQDIELEDDDDKETVPLAIEHFLLDHINKYGQVSPGTLVADH